MLNRSYRKAKAAGDSGPVKQVLELYNLERDPGERHNLASRRPELVIRLRNMALNYYRCQHNTIIRSCLRSSDECISENWFRHDSWDCKPQNMYGQVSLLVAGTNFPKISLLICNLLKVLDSASAFGGVSGWCRAVVDTRCQPDGARHREALRCVITCHRVLSYVITCQIIPINDFADWPSETMRRCISTTEHCPMSWTINFFV